VVQAEAEIFSVHLFSLKGMLVVSRHVAENQSRPWWWAFDGKNSTESNQLHGWKRGSSIQLLNWMSYQGRAILHFIPSEELVWKFCSHSWRNIFGEENKHAIWMIFPCAQNSQEVELCNSLLRNLQKYNCEHCSMMTLMF